MALALFRNAPALGAPNLCPKIEYRLFQLARFFTYFKYLVVLYFRDADALFRVRHEDLLEQLAEMCLDFPIVAHLARVYFFEYLENSIGEEGRLSRLNLEDEYPEAPNVRFE